MKAGFVAALVAAITASVIAVVPAFSTGLRGSASIPRRVKALETKVKALTTRVKADEACLKFVNGVAQYSGYLYTTDHGTTVVEASAASFTGEGQTPQGYVQLVDPQCITGSSAARYSLRHLKAISRP
jgi:hypothetical protein